LTHVKVRETSGPVGLVGGVPVGHGDGNDVEPAAFGDEGGRDQVPPGGEAGEGSDPVRAVRADRLAPRSRSQSSDRCPGPEGGAPAGTSPLGLWAGGGDRVGVVLGAPTSKRLAPVRGRPVAQRRADGFTDILDAYPGCGASPSEGGVKPHVTLTASARDLASSDVVDLDQVDLDAPWPFRLAWMGPISGEAARMLACDCDLIRMVLNADGCRSIWGVPNGWSPPRCGGRW
jgi:hypothetical protein